MAKGSSLGVPSTTGAKAPSSAKSSDGGGERHTGIKNGVGMGKFDGTGKDGLFNTGRSEGTCYKHGRKSYQ